MCLDLLGPMEIDDKARAELIHHLAADDGLSWDGDEESSRSEEWAGELLQLIVSLREYSSRRGLPKDFTAESAKM